MGRYKAPGVVLLYLPSLSLHTEQASELPGEISMLRALPQGKQGFSPSFDQEPFVLLGFSHGRCRFVHNPVKHNHSRINTKPLLGKGKEMG